MLFSTAKSQHIKLAANLLTISLIISSQAMAENICNLVICNSGNSEIPVPCNQLCDQLQQNVCEQFLHNPLTAGGALFSHAFSVTNEADLRCLFSQSANNGSILLVANSINLTINTQRTNKSLLIPKNRLAVIGDPASNPVISASGNRTSLVRLCTNDHDGSDIRCSDMNSPTGFFSWGIHWAFSPLQNFVSTLIHKESGYGGVVHLAHSQFGQYSAEHSALHSFIDAETISDDMVIDNNVFFRSHPEQTLIDISCQDEDNCVQQSLLTISNNRWSDNTVESDLLTDTSESTLLQLVNIPNVRMVDNTEVSANAGGTINIVFTQTPEFEDTADLTLAYNISGNRADASHNASQIINLIAETDNGELIPLEGNININDNCFYQVQRQNGFDNEQQAVTISISKSRCVGDSFPTELADIVLTLKTPSNDSYSYADIVNGVSITLATVIVTASIYTVVASVTIALGERGHSNARTLGIIMTCSLSKLCSHTESSRSVSYPVMPEHTVVTTVITMELIVNTGFQ